MDFEKQAQYNLLYTLAENVYPGRGLVVGRTPDGKLAIVYWIMGRSEDSQNRVFEQDDKGRVFTSIADPGKLKPGTNTNLILYNAMREAYSCHVVSNGDQTDDAMRGLTIGENFEESLRSRIYEPDAPNFTSRITAVLRPNDKRCIAEIGILHKATWNSPICLRNFYAFPDLPRGFGFSVTTYEGDGTPLPKFRGDPRPFPIPHTGAREIGGFFWGCLHPGNRVALAVKVIDEEVPRSTVAHLINRFEKVA